MDRRIAGLDSATSGHPLCPLRPGDCAIHLPIHNSSLDAASKINIEAVELFVTQENKDATEILGQKGFVLKTLKSIMTESLDFLRFDIRTSQQVPT
jgi:hypothetical protein